MTGILARFRNLTTACLVAVLVVLVGGAFPGRAAAVDIYYFSPDSPQRNLGGLKREMERFFGQADFAANFQPFAHYIDFDQTVREKHPPFLFLPAWYYRLYGEKLGLRPLLTPLRGGSSSYRKVLLVRKGEGIAMNTLANLSMAMTTMGPDDRRTLNSILFAAHGADANKLNIVTVPKDADALLALALGHVDLALVGKQSMELIGSINPKILQAVEPMAESAPIPGPIFCYVPSRVNMEVVEQMKQLLQRQQHGLNVLEILQIDGWLAVQN